MTTTPTAPAGPRPGRGTRRRTSPRVLLLALGGASLLAGLDAALLLVGAWAPVDAPHLGDVHGLVMVLGFMATLIALERAQALGQGWAYLAPTVLGLGGLALVAGAPPLLGHLLLLQGCLLFLAVYVALWRRAPLALVGVQLLAVVFATAASGLALVAGVADLLPLLAGFLVLTIAAERAELAQLTMGRRAVPTVVGLAGLVTLATLAALAWPGAGHRLFGAAVLAVALWLLRDDVARRMVRLDGLRRYTGAALLAGYGWLAVAGATWLVAGRPAGGYAYDIVIHATFLGFGVSMIMAHAPIIFPAVLGRPLPYRPVSWLPLAVLHGGLLARVGGGLAGATAVWQAGSIVTVVALLVFLVVSIALVVRA